MTKYIFAQVAPIAGVKGADPNVIGKTLEDIRTGHGGELRPRAVVDSASASASPIHRYFDWDDAHAADQHRLDQARTLIRSVRVVGEVEGRSTPAFLSVHGDQGVSYRGFAEVLSSADLRRRVLQQAEKDLHSWTERYRELVDVIGLLDPAKKELRRRISREGGAEENRPSS